MALMRLQKYLSSAGFCSRRKGEILIIEGKVKVNGRVVTELGTKIDPDKDMVTLEGQDVLLDDALVYIALNKPRGFVTSCRQPGDKIVVDLVDISRRIYPVGRLDKDSTGLLLLTNDGRLHHKLSHPSFDHEKEYEVEVREPLSNEALDKMAKGMVILGSRTRPAKIDRISPTKFNITLKEGKNRQIRRMVKRVGNRVVALKRIRIDGLCLEKLNPGEWRYLRKEEKKQLLKNTSLRDGADKNIPL